MSLKICESLDIKIENELINDYNLYDHQSLEVYSQRDTCSYLRLNFYQKLINNNKFFQIINSDIYYCPSYSINRITYIAGCHIFHSITKKANPSLIEKSKTDQFYYWANQFSFSYFCTKILNPYRKCSLIADIRTEYDQCVVTDNSPDNDENNFAIALDTFEQILDDSILEKKSLYDLYECSKIVGNCLGDFIYSKYHDIGNICLKKLLESAQNSPSFKKICI